MEKSARQAVKKIRRCIRDDRVILLPHFVHRMDQRGLFWADMLAVIDKPQTVMADGFDDWARPRWIITGETTGNQTLGMVCVIGHDAQGHTAVFVTIYWEQ